MRGLRTLATTLLAILFLSSLLLSGVKGEVSVVARPDGTSDSGTWGLHGVEGIDANHPTGRTTASSSGLSVAYNMGSPEDFSGNGYDATVTGATTTSGVIGQSYLFDASTEELVYDPGGGSALDITGDLTILAWIYMDSTAAGRKTILAKGDDGTGTEANYGLDINGAQVEFLYTTPGGGYHIWTSSSSGIVIGVWYHIAITFTFGTGSSFLAYLNASTTSGSWTTGTGNVAAETTTQALQVGRRDSSGGDDPFRGRIDEVSIFNRTLTQTEIAEYASVPDILHEAIDEVASDGNTTYIDTAAVSFANVTLSNIDDPDTDANHTLSLVARGTSAQLTLRQGTTVIATTDNFTLTATYAEYTYAIPTSQVSDISDYNNLILQVQGYNASITQVYLEVDDVPQNTGSIFDSLLPVGLAVAVLLIIIGLYAYSQRKGRNLGSLFLFLGGIALILTGFDYQTSIGDVEMALMIIGAGSAVMIMSAIEFASR